MMNEERLAWQTIRKVGYLGGVSPLPQDLKGAGSFLQAMVEVFARASASFFDEVNYLPFLGRERQVQAELLPAIHQVADVVLVEQTITRKRGRTKRTGWLDYVVRYKNRKRRYVFFIELKFDWIAATSPMIRQDTGQVWGEAQAQLNALRNPDLIEYGYDLGVENPKKLIKMALLVAPCYQGSKYAAKLTPSDRTLGAEIHQRLTHYLEPRPNLSYTWALHERLQDCHEFLDWHEIYPCVTFAARAETL